MTSTPSTSPDSDEDFQLPLAAAELYEERFVPTVFAEWAPVTLDAAAIGSGQRLLDVACGTGIVARTAHRDHGAEVVGVDRNQAMLTVAARVEPAVDWRRADVAELPLGDDEVDVATCQMAFMFFPDRLRALTEMVRVVRPGGRIAIVVPASIDAQPGYGPFVDVVADHCGPEARSLLGTYWNCGDLPAFAAAVTEAGATVLESRTRAGSARFASVRDFVDTEIDGSPLAERIADDERAAVVADLAPLLDGYGTEEGTLTIPLLCHVLSAEVPTAGA
ncbi:MAG: methyltransferase domain-containing protein [Actinomycetota bacterium]